MTKESLSNVDWQKRANRFRKPHWPILEDNLFQWIKKEQDEGRSISTIKIGLKTNVMDKEMGI